MADEENVEEATSAPEEEAAPVEKAPEEVAPVEEAKCAKCEGPLNDAGKCPVCDVEAPSEA